jgi:hypothetical protein
MPGVKSRKPGLASFGAPAALLLLVLLFFLPLLTGPGQLLLRDNGRMHAQVKLWIAQELAQGRLAEWDPYQGLGVPVVAGAIDAPLHPFNALLVALPFAWAFKAWALAAYALAALGMYAWARQLLLGRGAAVLAGVAFSLSGYTVSMSENLTFLTTLAALPLLLAAAHGWFVRGGAGRAALLAGASFLCAAGGDPQGWAFGIAALVLYGLVLRSQGSTLLRVALAPVLALAGAAPVVFPVVAWMGHSSRASLLADVEYRRWNLPLLRVAELVVPHVFRAPEGSLVSSVYVSFSGEVGTDVRLPWALSVYLGITVAALAALGARRSRAAALCLAVAGVAVWMALGANAGFWELARHVPIVRSLRYWEKLVGCAALFVALAAGFGAQALEKVDRPTRRAPLVAAGVAVLLIVAGLAVPLASAAANARWGESGGLLAANLADGMLAAGGVTVGVAAAFWLAAPLARRGLLAPALVALVLVDLLAANGRAYRVLPLSTAFPESPIADALATAPGLPRVLSPFDAVGDRFPRLPQDQASPMSNARLLATAWNVGRGVANFEAYFGMLPSRLADVYAAVPQPRRATVAGLWGFDGLIVPGHPDAARFTGLPGPYHAAAVDRSYPAFLVRIPGRPRAYLAAHRIRLEGGRLRVRDRPGERRVRPHPRRGAGPAGPAAGDGGGPVPQGSRH